MGKYLVPLTMMLAMTAFATAALLVGFVPGHPAWWRAAVPLAVLGGITPMIYAVNIRIVPVFARRPWRNHHLLRLQVALLIVGAWLVCAGRLTSGAWILLIGSSLCLASGLVFTVNIVRLFHQIPTTPPPPLPFSNQAIIDRLAVQFTRWAGIYLLVGLSVGVITSRWQPRQGRWDLVWAHAMLVGFFLSMAAGTSYHVLSRWTGRPWRRIWPIRLHLFLMSVGLPIMLLALATGWNTLFMIAGPLQAAALVLFLTTAAPLAVGLPKLSRWAVALAGALLVTGVGLGASFAIEPVLGAQLRLVHAEINLFGWAGLLISGMGFYLAPRLAGRPLKWPRLALVQLGLLVGGVALGAVVLFLRAYGHESRTALMGAQALVAGGFILFGGLIGATFFLETPRASTANVAAVQIGGAPRPPVSSLTIFQDEKG